MAVKNPNVPVPRLFGTGDKQKLGMSFGGEVPDIPEFIPPEMSNAVLADEDGVIILDEDGFRALHAGDR